MRKEQRALPVKNLTNIILYQFSLTKTRSLIAGLKLHTVARAGLYPARLLCAMIFDPSPANPPSGDHSGAALGVATTH